jgi:hypothetical protein
LDIVSLFNQPPAASDPPGANVLHVIGRNHSKPQKYFYRTFSNGIWSGWVPITVDIEGDHIVGVVWRGRLNLFWLTFALQAQQSGSTPSTTSGSQNLTALTFNDFSSLVAESKPQKTVKIQLNRTEYYQGKWATRVSSDLSRFTPIPVDDNFDPARDVYVRASIDTDKDGNETSVRIHLDGPDRSFRLMGKNCEPDFGYTYWQQAVNQWLGDTVYTTPCFMQGYDATKYVGSSPVFQSSFPQEIIITDTTGQIQIGNRSQEPILKRVNSFDLLPCDNPVVIISTGDLISSGMISSDSVYTGLISTLSSPFFYLDTADLNSNEELTFFVQPNLTERLVFQRGGWAVPPIFPSLGIADATYWSSIVLTPQVPVREPPIRPDANAIFPYQSTADWLTDDSAALAFGTSVIGRAGRLDSGRTVSGGIKGTGVKIISNSGLDFAGAVLLGRRAKLTPNSRIALQGGAPPSPHLRSLG